jgi:release factor glutamine methyltransferase
MPELKRRDFHEMLMLPDLDLYSYERWHHKLWQSFDSQLVIDYPGLNLPQLLRFFKDGMLARMPLLATDLINLQKLEFLEEWLRHLQYGKPLAHWVGMAWFHHIALVVDQHVLIPRPETEILVERALGIIKNIKGAVVVDVGTGPGTIALALAAAISGDNVSRIIAMDISPLALQTAKWNLFLARKEEIIELFSSDRLAGLPQELRGVVDLLVSNPPYIKKMAHRQTVHDQVLNYEPELALFLADEEYEQWQSHFFNEIHQCLKVGGHFLVEGHEEELENIMKMKCCQQFHHLQLINDYTNRVRFLYGQKL